MFCGECGTKSKEENALFCEDCGAAFNIDTNLDSQRNVSSLPSAAHPPSLSTAIPDVLPDGIKGWSWGALLLNWIWAIGNRTWIGLLALIPYVGFGIAIWLGFKGREMAWRNGKWESVEHFNRVQKRWSQWGVGVMIASLVIGVLAAIAIPAYHSYANRAVENNASEEIAAAISGGAGGNGQGMDTGFRKPDNVESGTIDSNADELPTPLDTVSGKLAKTQMSNGQTAITLNDQVLFNGDDAQWQKPVRVFKLPDQREFILMASSGGRGTSCETLFYFLIVDRSGFKFTPEFGSCSAQGAYTQEGSRITLKLPTMGGQSTVVFEGDTVVEDGKAVNLVEGNDPSK